MGKAADKRVLTVPVKYVYLDVVGFTRDRSVEAQSDVIDYLNSIVRDVVANASIPQDQVFLLPTGDGICIAMLNVEALFDIHIQIA
ncbi:MAG: hypothetical protein OEM41_07975, partial [Ignavibacteria bacterium]|nr:hypothetical protein [Ignavibacteria bacterium]